MSWMVPAGTLVLLSVASCAVEPERSPPPLPVFEVPCGMLVCPPNSLGTATFVGKRRFATCRHLLSEAMDSVSIDGVATSIVQVAGGTSSADQADDWVFFDVPETTAVPSWPRRVRIDFEHPLTPGQDVWLLGYGWPPNVAKTMKYRPTFRAIRHAIVARYPFPDPPPRIIHLQCSGTGPLKGLSGGPVIAYDEERNQAVVCGLVVGMTTYESEDRSSRIEIHTAVRPPSR